MTTPMSSPVPMYQCPLSTRAKIRNCRPHKRWCWDIYGWELWKYAHSLQDNLLSSTFFYIHVEIGEKYQDIFALTNQINRTLSVCFAQQLTPLMFLANRTYSEGDQLSESLSTLEDYCNGGSRFAFPYRLVSDWNESPRSKFDFRCSPKTWEVRRLTYSNRKLQSTYSIRKTYQSRSKCPNASIHHYSGKIEPQIAADNFLWRYVHVFDNTHGTTIYRLVEHTSDRAPRAFWIWILRPEK